ncbi:MAG: hypothetical protein JWR83_740 [Aeromicrobium sp.]|nr:hypothetical protein [Aeromicrobium sp.]
MTAVDGVAEALLQGNRQLADWLVRWLETGVRPDNLFADDLFRVDAQSVGGDTGMHAVWGGVGEFAVASP